jgi:hypothetical protein
MGKKINTYTVSGHINWNESNRFKIQIRSSNTNNARKNVIKSLIGKDNVFAVSIELVQKTRSIDNLIDDNYDY